MQKARKISKSCRESSNATAYFPSYEYSHENSDCTPVQTAKFTLSFLYFTYQFVRAHGQIFCISIDKQAQKNLALILHILNKQYNPITIISLCGTKAF
jgi:hypothetical protein